MTTQRSAAIGLATLLGGLAIGCGHILGPSAVVDGLRFMATASVEPAEPPFLSDTAIFASVTVRNVSVRPIERTYDGGCFIRRFQAFRDVDGERRLAWDSDRSVNWACTDDLAIVSLAPGEQASPHNWRVGVQRSVLRDSLPAGRYEIVIRIQANDETIRAGFVTLD
jgi:hypothetical protein